MYLLKYKEDDKLLIYFKVIKIIFYNNDKYVSDSDIWIDSDSKFFWEVCWLSYVRGVER